MRRLTPAEQFWLVADLVSWAFALGRITVALLP